MGTENTLRPPGYLPRLIERRLGSLMRGFGCVEIAGPKWCGKTWTGLSRCASVTRLDMRPYCDRFVDEDLHEDMSGILIHTASGSSDGSLGGSVRSGRPGHLEPILHKALDEALWCSGDPVCIESQGQGLDGCNLAACCGCALVPETSCEAGNEFLDRGLVVGTIGSPTAGLFGPGLRC